VNADNRSTRDGPGEYASDDVRARVAEIDRRVAELWATLAGQVDQGPGDVGDAATTLNVQDEIHQMIETLENEKRRLLGE
jgi:hypothetical protein